jgi:hypothetical protein
VLKMNGRSVDHERFGEGVTRMRLETGAVGLEAPGRQLTD